jgi:hypothetical protein
MRQIGTSLGAVYLLLSLLPRVSAMQQPIEFRTIDCLPNKCPPPWKMCGPCDHPCCCEKPEVCCKGRYGCPVHKLSKAGIPEFAYLQHYGPGPGPEVPCCGRNCTANQCLELILIELVTLETPLEVQQSRYKPVPDEERCCGQGCTEAQCFQDVSFTFVDLQTPIQLTLNSTDKGAQVDEGMMEEVSKVEI